MTHDTVLRPALPSDREATEELMREAFWNRYSPACSEHYLVHVMRECPDYVRELDYVAVLDNRIVGNVLYMKSHVATDLGYRQEVLCLGPVAVLPEYQGRGIGRILISHTRGLARRMGFRAIVLCGDPDYYIRVGFVPAERLGIRKSEDMYLDALLVCELYEDALAGCRGRYCEHPIYNVDGAAVSEFDKAFPPKPVLHDTPTQRRFLELAAMQHRADVGKT